MITVILQDGTVGVTTSAYPGLPATITVQNGAQLRGIVKEILSELPD